jgi:hypothetical protein
MRTFSPGIGAATADRPFSGSSEPDRGLFNSVFLFSAGIHLRNGQSHFSNTADADLQSGAGLLFPFRVKKFQRLIHKTK